MSGSLTSLTQLTGNVPVLGGSHQPDLGAAVGGELARAAVLHALRRRRGGGAAGRSGSPYPNMARADWQFMGAEDGPMPVQGRADRHRLHHAMGPHARGLPARRPGQAAPSVVRPVRRRGGVGRVRADFTEQQFGIIRFSVTFERFLPAKPPARDWFGQLQGPGHQPAGRGHRPAGRRDGRPRRPAGALLVRHGAAGAGGHGVDRAGARRRRQATSRRAVAPAVLALQTASPTFDNAFPGTVAALLGGAGAGAGRRVANPCRAPAIGAGAGRWPR